MGNIRAQLESNPIAQIGVIAALALVALVMFMRVSSGGGSEAAPEGEQPGAAAPATPAEGAAPAPSEPGAAAAPEAGSSGSAAPEGAPPGAAEGEASARGRAAFEARKQLLLQMIPGPGLPRRVVSALAEGRGVALVVTQRNGVEDAEMRRGAVALRRARGNRMAVMTVDVDEVSRYARITRGVDVNRVPALVVVPPLRIAVATAAGGPPPAVVEHGYLDVRSMVQAVDDALYEGGNVPLYPHR